MFGVDVGPGATLAKPGLYYIWIRVGHLGPSRTRWLKYCLVSYPLQDIVFTTPSFPDRWPRDRADACL
jgi:hypothetical protein